MKQGKGVLILFGIIGVCMVFGSAYFFVSTKQFIASALRAPGTVVDLVPKENDDGGYTYAPQVTFSTDEGEEYTFVSGASASPPAFSEGEIVEVLYEAKNPRGAKINAVSTLYGLPLIMGGMGIIFALVGIIPGTLFLRRKKQIAYLHHHGMRISAKVTEVEYRKNYKVNNKSPYRIWAEGTDPRNGTVSRFKSDNIWFNPEEFVTPGDIVEVLMHPQKTSVHYMETPFLPQDGKKGTQTHNPSIT